MKSVPGRWSLCRSMPVQEYSSSQLSSPRKSAIRSIMAIFSCFYSYLNGFLASLRSTVPSQNPSSRRSDLRQDPSHLLVCGSGKITIPEPYGSQWGWLQGTDHLIALPDQVTTGFRRRDRNGHHDLAGAVFPQSFDSHSQCRHPLG